MTGTAGGPGVSSTVRTPRRFRPEAFPSPVGSRLRSALVREHGRHPFTPRDVRDAARRVVDVAGRLRLNAVVVRGGVDVGGAELDHVWAVVDGRVVDMTLPLRSGAFLSMLRAYVAGDLSGEHLDRVVHGYTLEWRVVGEFPADVRYVGAPIWLRRDPEPGAEPVR